MEKEKLKKISRISWYAVSVFVALMLIVSGYGGMVNPDDTAIPAIIAMTFPLWLFLSVVLLVTELFLNRLMAIITGASLILSLGPVLSFCPMNFFPKKLNAEEKARSFTVMSYNVYGLNDFRSPYSSKDVTMVKQEAKEGRWNQTMKYVLDRDPDIVCLQEFYLAYNPNFPVLSRDLYQTICDRYPHRTRMDGAAILSKYPLYPVDMPDNGDPTFFLTGAITDIQGRRTLVVSVHLQSIGLSPEDRELYRDLIKGEGGRKAIREAKTQLLGKLAAAFRHRANQARLIRHQIDSIGVENVIVAGDFNDINDCYAMRELSQKEFNDAFTMAGCGPTITYHANRFFFNIDHILYRGDMEAVGYHKSYFGRSDHYPVEATFLWKKK